MTAATLAPVAVDRAALAEVRARTLALIAHLEPADLERQLSPILSPLVWDLAHIAAYEDLWLCHRHGGLALLRADLAAMYDAFETPRALRGRLALLDAAQAVAFLADVRTRTDAVLDETGGDGLLVEMVLRHELQHTETMLQAMALAGRLPERPAPRPLGGRDGWLDVPGGPVAIGAGPDGFAYDNERPRHEVELAGFRIARRPVTNAAWAAFAAAGGYARREWWSEAGWRWRERHRVTGHAGAAAGEPDAAVCGVSWFEAQAYARSTRARLPCEAEWERAAILGILSGAGAVWEWTSTPFAPYPGFVAHPYPEYSQVFFGDRHRVLRGGSWATHPRVATPTFRNWDLPERRQLFAGVRLVRSEED